MKVGPSLRIALFFFLICLLWIIGSDYLLLMVNSFTDVETYSMLQTYKGIAFIGAMSVLLYFLLRRHQRNTTTSEEAYRHLFATNPTPMWLSEPQTGEIILVNKAARNLYKYSEQDFLLLDTSKLVVEEDYEIFKKSILEKGQLTPFHHIQKHVASDGQILYVSVNRKKIRYEKDWMILTSVLDMTPWLQAEKELSAKDRQLRSLVDSPSNFLIQLSRDYEILSKNKPFEDFFTPRSDHFMDLIVEEEKDYFMERIRTCLHKPGKIVPILLESQIPDSADRVYIKWEFIALQGEDGQKSISIQGFGTNVTDQIRSLNELKHTHEEINLILNSIADPFLSIDLNSQIRKVNKEFCQLIDLPLSSVEGQKLSDVLERIASQDLAKQLQGLLGQTYSQHFEYQVNALDKWFLVSTYPFRNGMTIYFKDISEAIQQKMVIRESQERFNTISRATSDIVWDYDMKTDTIWWNKGLQHILGYQKDQTEVDWWEERIHPDDRERVSKSFNRAIENQENIWNEEYQFQCSDGSYKYLEDQGFLIYDDKQEPIRMIGAMRDIQMRKDYEEEINKLSLVASLTNNGVIILNEEEQVEWVNKGFERLSGYELEEVNQQKVFEILAPKDKAKKPFSIKQALKRRTNCSIDMAHRHKNGKRYFVKLDITKVLNDGELRYIVVETNITERQKYLRQVELQNEQMREIAHISSHKIRGPVATILGLVQLIDFEDWNNPQNKEMIMRLTDATRHMDTIIHQIVERTYAVELEDQEVDY